MYSLSVKRKDLIRKLLDLGWISKRQGGCHEIWTNGEMEESVPRHREIGESLAKKILKKAKNNPPKEDK